MPGGEGKRDSEDGFIVSIGRRITDSIGWTAAAEGSKLGQDRMKSRERYRQAKQIDTALGRTGEDWKEKDKAWMGTCACNVHVCNHQIAPPRGTNIGWASYFTLLHAFSVIFFVLVHDYTDVHSYM